MEQNIESRTLSAASAGVTLTGYALLLHICIILICTGRQPQKNSGAYLKPPGIVSADITATLSTPLFISKAGGPLVTSYRN